MYSFPDPADHTWLAKNIKRHMSRISRQSIATDAIPHSGAASACFTITSTNSATPSMLIRMLFAFTCLSPGCGLTWDCFTRAATIRYRMRSMPILDLSVQPMFSVGCSTIALHQVRTIFLFPFTCVVHGIHLSMNPVFPTRSLPRFEFRPRFCSRHWIDMQIRHATDESRHAFAA
ncbi:hypothetical protein RSAG8_13859, partial [Rhizoctonia solani AG-8 WAC10335]